MTSNNSKLILRDEVLAEPEGAGIVGEIGGPEREATPEKSFLTRRSFAIPPEPRVKDLDRVRSGNKL